MWPLRWPESPGPRFLTRHNLHLFLGWLAFLTVSPEQNKKYADQHRVQRFRNTVKINSGISE